MESRTIPPDHASARQTEMGERFNRVLFAALDALQAHKIPYALIGGIAASGLGRPRSTHDIDVFVRPEDADSALEALGLGGFETEKTDPRWLYKGWMEDQMVDIIFKSQGDIYFDTEMHQHVKAVHYHGRNIPAVAPEDLIIIKAAVHSEIGPHHWHDALAILSHAQLDWSYLLRRARRAARRLLSLLIYAQANDIWIPNYIIVELYNVIFQQQMGKPTAAGFFAQSQPIQAPPQESAPPQPHQHHAHKPAGDAYLIGHLYEALTTDPRTASLDVQIAIGGKKILLKGEAPTPECRKAIEDVVRAHAAGYEIDNQVRITVLSAPEVEEVV